jgi:ADP-heptose:LPS heptosyltransferase
MPILDKARGHCLSLVYNRRSDEVLPDGVADAMALVTDMADTAALMSALDLVITSDTATAHLAGALGVPTWVVLHEPPDWRWLLRRSDSPWYPTMRLFRQRRPGDWSTPVAEIAAALNLASSSSD